ncbi:MAG: Uma2 family endonuclease [Cuspidothrix sp.]
MTASPNYDYISPAEYLAREETSPIKHEYRQGQVYAMAGASNIHVVITLNIASLLRNHLRGSGCQTYIADTKAHIESIDTYYYPDVVVSCDSRDKAFNNFLRYPCLIIEVLSPTTEGFDRGDKFADYRQLESLQEYVLVSQNKTSVEVFRRNLEGQWVFYSYGKGENIHLASVNFQLAVEDVYEDISFESVNLP